ncbi:MAG: response regulator transcription factor [Actinomycetota bacterium]|nr:response regulator transcription factor [Actinomycetota bacterium]
MVPCRVLVLDERRLLAAGLAHVLELRSDVAQVRVAQEFASLPAVLADGWDVVVTSAGLAEEVLRLASPDKRVLVIVQVPDVPQIARLLARGAAGICTPADVPGQIADAVQQVAAGEMRLPATLTVEVLQELYRLRARALDAEVVLAQLSDREREVLNELGEGRGRAEMGRALGLSPNTVRTHVQHLLRKLSLHSQQEAAAFARELEAARAPLQPHYEESSVVIDLTARKASRLSPDHSPSS